MGFARASILTFEWELELAKAMQPLWLDGKSALYIYNTLLFGQDIKVKSPLKVDNGKMIDNPYRKLTRLSPYQYRQKFMNDEKWIKKATEAGKHFDFPRRKRGVHPGSPHYKNKQTEILTPEEFMSRLNANCPKMEDPANIKFDYPTQQYAAYEAYDSNRRERAYALTTYWSPLRKSEIYERLLKDFTLVKIRLPDNITGMSIKINLWRKKKYHNPKKVAIAAKDPKADKEPFYLWLGEPERIKALMLNEVIDWVFGKFFDQETKTFRTHRPDERVFNFEGWTALTYIKEIFGADYYCHFGRSNYISKAIDGASNPGQLVSELIDDTHMDFQTVVNYIMHPASARSNIAKREWEKTKQEIVET